MTTNNTVTATTDLATRARTALDRLNSSASRSSLDDMVKARTRRSLLLVDCSASMGEGIAAGGTRIAALRKVVDSLRETHPAPVAAFGVRCDGQVEVVERIPEPQGSTPIDLAIHFGKAQGANHLVIVTDGEPNDAESAFAAARAFGHPIDVFFIGDEGDPGAQFCQRLAKVAGGTCGVTDLGDTKQLAGKIAGFLGDGTAQTAARAARQMSDGL